MSSNNGTIKKIKNNSQPRNNGRGRRSRSKNICPSKFSEHKGHRFSPAPNPPDVAYMPWNSITLAEISGPGLYTFEKLVATFRAQVDPRSTGLNTDLRSFDILFRVQSISVWNLTGKALSLSVIDDVTATSQAESDVLGGWVDCGGPSYFPSIGYNYPLSHSTRVHHWDQGLNKTTKIFVTTASADGDRLLSHLRILWKFEGTVSFKPTVELPEIVSIAERIEAATTAIKNLQPSLIKRVVDGVSIAATPVVALASIEGSITGEEVTSAIPRLIPKASNPEVEAVEELERRVSDLVESTYSSEHSDFTDGSGNVYH